MTVVTCPKGHIIGFPWRSCSICDQRKQQRWPCQWNKQEPSK